MIVDPDAMYSSAADTRWIAYVPAYKGGEHIATKEEARQVLAAMEDRRPNTLFAAPDGRAYDDAVLAKLASIGLAAKDVVPYH